MRNLTLTCLLTCLFLAACAGDPAAAPDAPGPTPCALEAVRTGTVVDVRLLTGPMGLGTLVLLDAAPSAVATARLSHDEVAVVLPDGWVPTPLVALVALELGPTCQAAALVNPDLGPVRRDP